MKEICFQTEEVSDAKWVSLEELKCIHFETGGTKDIQCQKYRYMNLLYPCINKLSKILNS